MIPVNMMTQPNDTTWRPRLVCMLCITIMAILFRLKKFIGQVEYLESGGTLAVLLALHALKRGIKLVFILIT